LVVSSYTVKFWKKQKAGPSKKQSNSGEWEETARRAKKNKQQNNYSTVITVFQE
jgi:hypothetical protein